METQVEGRRQPVRCASVATQTRTEIIDDIDGRALRDPITIEFAIDGVAYEFDTSAKHAKEFRQAVEPYTSVARRVKPAPTRRRRSSPRPTKKRLSATAGTGRSPEQLAAIREWARQNGHTVSDKGRIARSVVDAFDAAH